MDRKAEMSATWQWSGRISVNCMFAIGVLIFVCDPCTHAPALLVREPFGFFDNEFSHARGSPKLLRQEVSDQRRSIALKANHGKRANIAALSRSSSRSPQLAR